jgi:hypothetical protein
MPQTLALCKAGGASIDLLETSFFREAGTRASFGAPKPDDKRNTVIRSLLWPDRI